MNAAREGRLAGEHLADGEMVRYVDGDGERGELQAWGRHVRRCEACARAVDRLREGSDLIGVWLERADFEADLPEVERGAWPEGLGRPVAARTITPAADGAAARAAASRSARGAGRARSIARPAARRWLQAAAILVLVAAPLAALPGVRAWVVERVAGNGQEPSVAATAAAPTPAVLRFTPDAGTFTVRVDPVENGTLHLNRADGDEAILRAGGTPPETQVSAGSLRIGGGEGVGAEGVAGGDRIADAYRLALPAGIRAVRVEIGDRVVEVSGAELDHGIELSLEP